MTFGKGVMHSCRSLIRSLTSQYSADVSGWYIMFNMWNYPGLLIMSIPGSPRPSSSPSKPFKQVQTLNREAVASIERAFVTLRNIKWYVTPSSDEKRTASISDSSFINAYKYQIALHLSSLLWWSISDYIHKFLAHKQQGTSFIALPKKVLKCIE